MGFPSRRFQQAGATLGEIAVLEGEFAALSPSERDAEESALARVDETSLVLRLERLRDRSVPADTKDEGQAREGEQRPVGEPGDTAKPKRANKAAQDTE